LQARSHIETQITAQALLITLVSARASDMKRSMLTNRSEEQGRSENRIYYLTLRIGNRSFEHIFGGSSPQYLTRSGNRRL